VAITYIIAYLPTMYGGYATGITWIPIVSSFKTPEKELNAKVRIFISAMMQDLTLTLVPLKTGSR